MDKYIKLIWYWKYKFSVRLYSFCSDALGLVHFSVWCFYLFAGFNNKSYKSKTLLIKTNDKSKPGEKCNVCLKRPNESIPTLPSALTPPSTFPDEDCKLGSAVDLWLVPCCRLPLQDWQGVFPMLPGTYFLWAAVSPCMVVMLVLAQHIWWICHFFLLLFLKPVEIGRLGSF